MKDEVKVAGMIKEGKEIVELTILADYHVFFVFRKEEGKVKELSAGEFIPPGVRERMMEKVNRLFFPPMVTQVHLSF